MYDIPAGPSHVRALKVASLCFFLFVCVLFAVMMTTMPSFAICGDDCCNRSPSVFDPFCAVGRLCCTALELLGITCSRISRSSS